MGNPFMVDQETIRRLTELKLMAEANPATEQEMRAAVAAMEAGNFCVAERNVEQTIDLPFGYTLTYTVEWQPHAMARHVSIASPSPDRVPILEAARMVMPHLGFDGSTGAQTHDWVEPMPNGGMALNVLEFMA